MKTATKSRRKTFEGQDKPKAGTKKLPPYAIKAGFATKEGTYEFKKTWYDNAKEATQAMIKFIDEQPAGLREVIIVCPKQEKLA